MKIKAGRLEIENFLISRNDAWFMFRNSFKGSEGLLQMTLFNIFASAVVDWKDVG